MQFIVNRVKALILIIVGAFRRALCCFRGRRRSQMNEDEFLTNIIIPSRGDDEVDAMRWSEHWGDDGIRKPQTVQDHIQLYREKLGQANIQQNNPDDNQALDHLFQEMTPRYIKQKKVVIENSNDRSHNNAPDLSRLAVSSDTLADLGEWMEEANSGWDEQHIDATDVLREQRRLKRENKHPNTSLGRKIKT